MIRWRRIAAIAVMTILTAGGVRAAQGADPTSVLSNPPAPHTARERNPRAALTAVALNIFFLPVRLPLTVLGAFGAGFTGFLTFGGKHAADDVFAFVDGTQVIDEHVVEGREPFCIGHYDCPEH